MLAIPEMQDLQVSSAGFGACLAHTQGFRICSKTCFWRPQRTSLCREAEASKEKETRSGLLMIATKAALAEQELLTARLHSESQRLGNLTIGMAGHLGYNLLLS